MRYFKAVVIVAALLLALAGSFWLGRLSAVKHTVLRDTRDAEVTFRFARFQKFSQDIGHYLMAQDGRIPADAYRALIDAKVASFYEDFIFGGDVVTFEVLRLPCLMNTDIAKNVKAPFCWTLQKDIGEVWVYYLDGSCERKSGQDNFGKTQVWWDRTFHEAGYPYWMSPEEKTQWCQSHGQLEWDADRGFYVPPEQPGR